MDKIGTLLKHNIRTEKTGKIGTFLCRLTPQHEVRSDGVEFFPAHTKKEEGDVGMFEPLSLIAVSVILTGGMCDVISGFSTGCKKLFSL